MSSYYHNPLTIVWQNAEPVLPANRFRLDDPHGRIEIRVISNDEETLRFTLRPRAAADCPATHSLLPIPHSIPVNGPWRFLSNMELAPMTAASATVPASASPVVEACIGGVPGILRLSTVELIWQCTISRHVRKVMLRNIESTDDVKIRRLDGSLLLSVKETAGSLYRVTEFKVFDEHITVALDNLLRSLRNALLSRDGMLPAQGVIDPSTRDNVDPSADYSVTLTDDFEVL